MASILNWIQADEKKASSKHANSYTHAIFSIFFGLLGSVGLGYLAVKHNIVNKLTENSYLKKEKVQPVNPDIVLKPRAPKRELKKIVQQEVKKEIALE